MIPISGAHPKFERAIRAALAKFPSWFVSAAHLSKITISGAPEVREQVAMYRHGTRDLLISPGVGDVLTKAIGHELAHACDDREGMPHYFTGTAEWQKIHRNQSHFDIPKYAAEGLEYFADCVVKLLMLGPAKFQTTHPEEVAFITTWVFPELKES